MIDEKVELKLINYIARNCESVDITEEIKHYVIDDITKFIAGFIRVLDKERDNG